jgi:hypothetical protein
MGVGGMLFADTCNPGEYMICNLDPQYGSECNDCGCAQCPPGQTSDGTGLVTYCPNQYGDSGCYAASVGFCAGYTNGCPGLGYGFLCKDEQQNCGGITGCTKVKACNIETGETQYLVSGNCHMENDTCYSNTRACRDFSNRVETNGTTSMSCNPEMQQGNAVWQQNAWYTEGCECKRDNVENTGLLRCERVNARAYVKSSNAQVTLSVNDDIIYTLEYMYCAKCHPGYLPNIVTGQNANYLHPSNTNSDWGVLTCATVVSAPDYAPGCVIDFNLSTDDMMAECRKTCPTGFATEAPGATNVEDCQYDGHTTYTDDTGTFYIGSLDECL